MAIADQVVRSLAGDPRYAPMHDDPRRHFSKRRQDSADVLVVDHLVARSWERRSGAARVLASQTLVALYGTDELLMTDALVERADGILFADINPNLIPDVLDIAKTGHCLIPTPLGAGDPVTGARLHRVRLLTNIERQVLSQLCEGLTNRRIAERLDIPVRQIKPAVRRILTKLGLSNRTEAAVFCACHKGALDGQSGNGWRE